jgi:cell division protein FtsB
MQFPLPSTCRACLTRPVNVDLGIWDKLTKLVIGLLLAAGLLLVAFWYLPLIKQNERMRKEVLRLDTQIQKEEENAKQLKTSIDALRNDPKAVERLAREKLGYAKPGEIVFRFEDAGTNRSSVR